MKCNHTCKECGKLETGDWVSETATQMIAKALCFSCNHWHEKLGRRDLLVIDNYTYSVGDEPREGERRRFLGMGGRRFDIELADGRRFTTHNLWSGGEVPDHFRKHFPNNASFVSGSREKVGETTCWNPADPRSEKYPTYQQLKQAA